MNQYRYNMIGNAWRVLKMIVVGVGVLLAFASLIECLQAYQILHGIHPYLGAGFVVVLLGGVGWALSYYIVFMLRRPAFAVPPQKFDLDSASIRAVRRYGRYLAAVIDRLADNPLVGEDQCQGLHEQAIDLSPSFLV